MLQGIPKISILIPTLNAQSVLEKCLKSISSQKYQPDQIEIIVADGGSSDKTVDIALSYGATIVPNPLKTGESGKMAALKACAGDYVALIDSDNILPDSEWLLRMVGPLVKHPEAVGSEPLEYTWRKEDGFITRYSALLGMNDPLVHYLGNYDRMNYLSGTWTRIVHTQVDFGNYLLVTFDSKTGVPTVGANGTLFDKQFLLENCTGDYLFDIDVLSTYLSKNPKLNFIKVKTGIIHTFCENDILKFSRKQERRIADFMFHKSQGLRSYKWESGGIFDSKKVGLAWFVVSCVAIFPLLFDSIIGYIKKPDIAWFFHPIACEITFYQYVRGYVKSLFSKSELDRTKWKQ